MSYMYGICYVPFFSKNRLSKVPSSNPFPPQKNAQIVNLKNWDLDLIRRIHPECGFYGFMIRFWICPPKTRNPFLDSEIRILIRNSTHIWRRGRDLNPATLLGGEHSHHCAIPCFPKPKTFNG